MFDKPDIYLRRKESLDMYLGFVENCFEGRDDKFGCLFYVGAHALRNVVGDVDLLGCCGRSEGVLNLAEALGYFVKQKSILFYLYPTG